MGQGLPWTKWRARCRCHILPAADWVAGRGEDGRGQPAVIDALAACHFDGEFCAGGIVAKCRANRAQLGPIGTLAQRAGILGAGHGFVAEGEVQVGGDLVAVEPGRRYFQPGHEARGGARFAELEQDAGAFGQKGRRLVALRRGRWRQGHAAHERALTGCQALCADSAHHRQQGFRARGAPHGCRQGRFAGLQKAHAPGIDHLQAGILDLGARREAKGCSGGESRRPGPRGHPLPPCALRQRPACS